MSIQTETKPIGRPFGRGMKKVALKELMDRFKTDYLIPVPYSFAKEHEFLNEKPKDDTAQYYEESLFD